MIFDGLAAELDLAAAVPEETVVGVSLWLSVGEEVPVVGVEEDVKTGFGLVFARVIISLQ